MKSFLQLRKGTEKQLDRGLNERELVFLRWVYERYKEENGEKVNT